MLIAAALPSAAAAANGNGGASYPGDEQLSGGTSAGGGGSSTGQSGGLSAGPQPQHRRAARREPNSGAAQSAPSGPARSATLLPNGKARPPEGAPAAVKRAIRLGNRLQKKPYRFGGGHLTWEDTAYDCSGASSYVLRGSAG